MLGVIIGVSSFIAIVGLIQSARFVVKKKVYTYGTNAISVSTAGKEFSQRDYDKLKTFIQDINLITPVYPNGSLPVKSSNKQITSRVYGTTNDFFLIQDWSLADGRIFSELEIDSYQKVAVIGNSQSTQLFNGNSMEKIIYLNGIPFRVVGVLNSKGKALSGRDFDNIVVIPHTTMKLRLANSSSLREILFSVSNPESIKPAIGAIQNYFSYTNNASFEKLNYITIVSSKDQLKETENIIEIMSILLGLSTTISLVVGGINIMNIMHAAVTERIKEIGIRMAVGAKKADIMIQFLIESSMIGFIGGIIGVIIGAAVNFVIVYFIDWPFFFSLSYVIVSFVFSIIVGIVFGIYPARKASDMIPVEALNFS